MFKEKWLITYLKVRFIQNGAFLTGVLTTFTFDLLITNI
jgi:hypothetical protein